MAVCRKSMKKQDVHSALKKQVRQIDTTKACNKQGEKHARNLSYRHILIIVIFFVVHLLRECVMLICIKLVTLIISLGVYMSCFLKTNCSMLFTLCVFVSYLFISCNQHETILGVYSNDIILPLFQKTKNETWEIYSSNNTIKKWFILQDGLISEEIEITKETPYLPILKKLQVNDTQNPDIQLPQVLLYTKHSLERNQIKHIIPSNEDIKSIYTIMKEKKEYITTCKNDNSLGKYSFVANDIVVEVLSFKKSTTSLIKVIFKKELNKCDGIPPSDFSTYWFFNNNGNISVSVKSFL